MLTKAPKKTTDTTELAPLISPRLRLSTTEAARLAKLRTSDPHATLHQDELKRRLFNEYRRGTVDTPRDKYKAFEYKDYAHPDTELDQKDSSGHEHIHDESANNTLLKTQTLYTGLGWYTSTRLAFGRADRVVSTAANVSASTATVNISGSPIKLTSIMGLSYGLELFIDFCVLIKHIVKPDKEDQHLSAWIRFRNALTKDFRPSRMVNAAAWFTINLVCIFPPVRALVGILNISLFAFDLIHDKIREKYAQHEDQTLLNKIDKRIIELENDETIDLDHSAEYKVLNEHKKELIASAETYNQAKVRSTRISAGIFTGMLMFYFPQLLLFAVAFTLFYAATEAPKNSYKRAGLVALGILATAAAVGVLLFPPAQMAMAAISAATMLAGAITSLVVGSIYGGFGTRISNGPIGQYCKKIYTSIANSALGVACGNAVKFVVESPVGQLVGRFSRWLNKPYNGAEPETAIQSLPKPNRKLMTPSLTPTTPPLSSIPALELTAVASWNNLANIEEGDSPKTKGSPTSPQSKPESPITPTSPFEMKSPVTPKGKIPKVKSFASVQAAKKGLKITKPSELKNSPKKSYTDFDYSEEPMAPRTPKSPRSSRLFSSNQLHCAAELKAAQRGLLEKETNHKMGINA